MPFFHLQKELQEKKREFTEKELQEYFIFHKNILGNTNIKNFKCFKFAECFVF